MNEKERQAFEIVFRFYEKWREQILETDDQWHAFSDDVGRMAADLDIDNNPLGWHMMCAALETFNDLYKDGRKPMPANYFGRDGL